MNEKLKPLNEDLDARRWADEFLMVHNSVEKPDYDWMVAWFANSIMCGVDVTRWKMEKDISDRDRVIDLLVKAFNGDDPMAVSSALSEAEKLRKV